MGLTDATRFSDDPAEDAARYISNVRLAEDVRKRCIPGYFDPSVKPVDIFTCIRYLKQRGKWGFDCTCGAKRQIDRKHGEQCMVSPIYANLCKEMEISPELFSGAIAFKMWNLLWDDWDTTKYEIRNIFGGQEFPYESDKNA